VESITDTSEALRPSAVTARCCGTTSCRRLADCKRCRPTTSETGVQQPTRYFGALPQCQVDANASTSRTCMTRSGTSSQCSSVLMSVARPRSYFLVPLTTRAAALSTRCSLFIIDFSTPASTALQWSMRDVTIL